MYWTRNTPAKRVTRCSVLVCLDDGKGILIGNKDDINIFSKNAVWLITAGLHPTWESNFVSLKKLEWARKFNFALDGKKPINKFYYRPPTLVPLSPYLIGMGVSEHCRLTHGNHHQCGIPTQIYQSGGNYVMNRPHDHTPYPIATSWLGFPVIGRIFACSPFISGPPPFADHTNPVEITITAPGFCGTRPISVAGR